MGVPAVFDAKVVGLTYVPGYPDNVMLLDGVIARQYLYEDGEGIPVVLVRNPLNEHDPNAIEVHAPILGDPGMIGHIPAALAARLAPEIDAGRKFYASISKVATHPDHPLNPGVHLSVSAVDSESEPF